MQGRYSDKTIADALRRYDLGHTRADIARSLGINAKSITYWIERRQRQEHAQGLKSGRRAHSPNPRLRADTYSPEARKKVLRGLKLGMSVTALAQEHGMSRAAVSAISRAKEEPKALPKGKNATLGQLLEAANPNSHHAFGSAEAPRTVKYPPQTYSEALERYAAGESIAEISRSLKLKGGVLMHWVRAQRKRAAAPPRTLRPGQKYDNKFRAAAVERVVLGTESRRAVAKSLNISPALIGEWVRNYCLANNLPVQKPAHTDYIQQRAIQIAHEEGPDQAAKLCGASKATVIAWCRQAGVKYKGSRGTRVKREIPVSHDKDFSWMDDETPELESWKPLAVAWIKLQSGGVSGRLRSLRLFFKKYLNEKLGSKGWMAEPAQFLSRQTHFPTFHDSTLGHLKDEGATVVVNYAADFLDWVLLRDFSINDDYGRPVILQEFHNPIERRDSVGSSNDAESVRSPLPYKYIDELRSLLVEGPSFSDWTWAQQVLDYKSEAGVYRTTDWYEVEEKEIDKTDPDCVWRKRIADGKEIYEMWSPARWVCLLTKLILPLRTLQTRFLDSGEADYWVYKREVGWRKNTNPLREGTFRKPLQQGFFRKVQYLGQASSAPPVVLYINTNKSADIQLSGAHKGFEMPWLFDAPMHNNIFYWAQKLRRWQEKYNPVDRRYRWDELPANRRDVLSDQALARFPAACFLFRLPEEESGKRWVPPSDTMLTTIWRKLLLRFEDILEARGEVHLDKSKIRFVREDSNTAVFFPLHSLRVSLITALALEGRLPFPILQKLVGHSRLLMTLLYTKLGTQYPTKELEAAYRRLEERKEENLTRFMRDTEHRKLVMEAIANSPESLALAMPVHPAQRNPAGWMFMFHGMCMMGGNTSPIEGNRNLGGCYNGGPNINSHSNPRHGPVPGGAKNCVRCRWFVTAPHYLWALQHHVNVLFYRSDEAQLEAAKYERRLVEVRAARVLAEERHEKFDATELDMTVRLFEGAMQKYSDSVEDVAATVRLMQRCVERMEDALREGGEKSVLIAAGAKTDVELAVREVNSELLQLSGVCDAAEIYPEVDIGKAGVRRSQLLDSLLIKEGRAPILLTLSEEHQLLAGNAFMRNLGALANPKNPLQGRAQVIEFSEANQRLSDAMGVDIGHLLLDSVQVTSSKAISLCRA